MLTQEECDFLHSRMKGTLIEALGMRFLPMMNMPWQKCQSVHPHANTLVFCMGEHLFHWLKP